LLLLYYSNCIYVVYDVVVAVHVVDNEVVEVVFVEVEVEVNVIVIKAVVVVLVVVKA